MTADNATLVERIELDPTLIIFRIRPDAVPPSGEPWFLPGPYVTIGAAGVQRAYSIASEPGERRWLEFYIRFAREPETVSPLTHMLWTMPVGTRVSPAATVRSSVKRPAILSPTCRRVPTGIVQSMCVSGDTVSGSRAKRM